MKELRLKSGLTQVQIADLLCMEQSNVSKIERGERYIDTLFFIDYCKACGAVPAEVIAKVDDSEHQGY
nr:helix-turn-helix transcriptional regulator [Limnohabitans sp. MMS-10A-160]